MRRLITFLKEYRNNTPGLIGLGILVFFALLAIYGSKVSLFIAFFVSLVSLL